MSLTVVVLCAAWCKTCREFEPVVDRVAAARAGMRFVWCDVEDDSNVCGDIDVENFPTLAIFRGDEVLHFGVSLPHENVVGRLIDALAGQPVGRSVDKAVQALPQRLSEG